MPSGRPHASCLRKVEAYLKDMGMVGLAVWRLPERWPDGGLSEGYEHDGPINTLHISTK